MKPTLKPRVKICGIGNIEEAIFAIELGASAIGLVAEMPSGPGIICDEKIYEIAKSVPPPIASFLLTSKQSSSDIIEHHKRTQTNTIQIVNELNNGNYIDIRNALPGIHIVKVIHVMDENSIKEAIEVSKYVDAVLLDTGNLNLEIKELGGTGRVHDWKISKRIRECLEIPVFLAGGIKAENVKDAIEAVHPFGIDVCSSVRTNNKLDFKKLENFFKYFA